MSKRTEQVSELLRQDINNILVKHFESPKGMLISVSDVTISPDLKNATAFLSIIPNNKLGSGLKAIKKESSRIQHKLSKQLSMKFTPRIHWKIDERDLKYKEIDKALNT